MLSKQPLYYAKKKKKIENSKFLRKFTSESTNFDLPRLAVIRICKIVT